MPPTAATGRLGKALSYLRTSLSNSAAFQTLTGSGNATEALEHIYLEALPPPANNAENYSLTELGTYRPFAIVFKETFVRSKTAIPASFETALDLGIYLEQAIASEIADDPWEVVMRWQNIIDAIREEVEAQADTAGRLCFDAIEQTELERCRSDEIPGEGNHQWATLILSIGAET